MRSEFDGPEIFIGQATIAKISAYAQKHGFFSPEREEKGDNDGDHAGNSTEVAAVNFPGDERYRTPLEQAKHNGTVSG